MGTMKLTKTRWIALAVAALLALGGTAWWWWRDGSGAVQYRTAKVERGSLQATVAASGTVTPVTQVQVGTQVSGQIKELFADFNSEVKAGQLLARIDPEAFEYKLRQVQADLDSARAQVMNAQASAAAGQAAVSRAAVDLAEAQRALQRNQDLVAQGFISAAQLETSRALVASQQAAMKSAQAQAAVGQAQIASAQAAVRQREALVAQAKIDIERTEIRSPVSGVVIKRSVELGQTVAASLQAPELFVIAQNLQDMQVQVAIDEADISRVKVDQKASFTVDAFTGRTFDGKVTQVRKASTNTQNVITYTVVVSFANAESRLLPGMTANVKLATDTRDNVLKVPNAALRVRIPGVEPAGPAGSGAMGGPADAAARPREGVVRNANAQDAPRREVTPEQRARFQAMRAEGGGRQRARIYLLVDGRPQAHNVRTGITDGAMTEISVPPNSPGAAVVVEGADVIVGTVTAGAEAGRPAATRPAGPRMQF
jgi:HlyD family secretion protein